MRGIPGPVRKQGPAARISPAHAGNTSVGDQPSGVSTDQPRTCGEYLTGSGNSENDPGSAPHMRGILGSHFRVFLSVGISPAHAGNTMNRGEDFSARTDQPRTCGEYRGEGGCFPGAAGSAPHMRGIRSGGGGRNASFWISPAHAGNTSTRPTRPSTSRDQPRTCGEYSTISSAAATAEGSAPHMRGIQQ